MLLSVSSVLRTHGCFNTLCLSLLIAFPLKKTKRHFWSLCATGILYFLSIRNHDSIFKLFNILSFIHLQCLYWMSKLGALEGFPWNFCLIRPIYMLGKCRQTEVLNICLYKVHEPESIFFGLSILSCAGSWIFASVYRIFSHWEDSELMLLHKCHMNPILE